MATKYPTDDCSTTKPFDITAPSWLVIRRYRSKVRVVGMKFSRHEAADIFAREAEKMRDGFLHLYEVAGMKEVVSKESELSKRR